MTTEFEIADGEKPRTSTARDHRRLPWPSFGLRWLAIGTLFLAAAALIGKATGLLGVFRGWGSGPDEWTVVAGGLLGGWLGTMAALGLAWARARRRGREEANRWRLAAALVLGQACIGSYVGILLFVPVEFVAKAAWGGSYAGLLVGLGLATGGVLLGSRLLGPTIPSERLVVPAVGFAIVALAMIPFADPSDVTDLGFGMSMWSLGPVWFGLAAPRWFGGTPAHEEWAARLRAYVGITAFALATGYLVLLPRVVVGYGVF